MTAPTAKVTLTADLLKRFKAYEENGHEEWGSLHIVLADGNVGDDCVRFCIDSAKKKGDKEGEELAEILLQMSKSQRGRIARRSLQVKE